MGLETFQFISDLDKSNPTPQDKRRFGDDHLRGIKETLKNTFPNANGAINPSVAEFNRLVGVTSNIQTQLDAKLESADVDLAPYGRLDTAQVWTKTQRIANKDHGNQSGSLILNMSEATTHIIRATDNLTLSFSNLAEGMEVVLKIVQGKATTPAATVTLPGEMRFAFGVPPTLTTTNGKYDIIGGKVIDGVVVAGFLPEVA